MLDTMKLVERTKEYGDTSFAELSKMEGCGHGDVSITFPNRPNTVLWGGFDQETADQIVGLLEDGQLHLHPCHFLVYLADGVMSRLPIAVRPSKTKDYKEPHWLPTVLKTRPL